MKKSLRMSFVLLIAALVLMWGAGAVMAESGGYGGSAAPKSSSGGYGGGSSSSSGGYGSAPAAPKSSSGGYGGGSSSSSGGYGGGSAAPKASGGYGGGAPAGGYGSAPAAPAAKKPMAATAPASSTAPAQKDAPAAATAPATTAPETTTPAATAPAAAPVQQQQAAPAPAPVQEQAPGFPSVNFMFLVSALAMGMALGWVLQRGRFCMNSAFRDTIFIQDYTYMRAYILALLVAIVGTNALSDMGLFKISAQPFWPLAHIIGGYVFGLGIVLAGGCGSGIWYRVGEGMLAAWVAVLGFFIGIAATMAGVLKPLYVGMRSIMWLGDTPTLYQLVGNSMGIKWGVIAVIVAGGGYFVSLSDPLKFGKQKGYYWSVTGVLIGLIAVGAFWASAVWGGGFARGLSFTTPTIELFNAITKGESTPSIFPLFQMGHLKVTWGVFFIIGVPFGAYLSARGLKEFSWKCPPAKELLTVFGGSLIMGFGAAAALGCNMGQGITGVATLSVGSIIATLSIILGNWTMVYFKFIKPMQDMDE